MNKYAMRIVLAVIALFLLADTALAQRRGGGGGRGGGGRGGGMRGGGGGMRGGGGFPSRGGSISSVTRPSRPSGGISNRPGNIANRPGNITNRPGNRPGNINNISGGNVINNRPVNVRDVDVNGGWGGYGDWNDGCCYNHPVAAAAAIGTAAAITSAAIGSVVYSLPSSCTAVVVNGITYEQCDGTYYQPQFMGTETTYVVVSPP